VLISFEASTHWHGTDAARHWNGPISFHEDGTVMALSILPIREKRPL
jgi:hypothetical protein